MSVKHPVTYLVEYLQSAYAQDELEDFLRFTLENGDAIANTMQQANSAMATFASEVVLALWRRSLLNNDLWQALRTERPCKAGAVDGVAQMTGRLQREELRNLLLNSFSYSELRMFTTFRLSEALVKSIATQAAFTQVVTALRQSGLLNRDFFEALVNSRPHRSEPEKLRQLWETFQRADLDDIHRAVTRLSEAPAALERVTNALAKFNDPVQFRTTLAQQEARVVRIDHGERGSGTGFLVGPDLVLTARHVLPSGALNNVTVLLDHKRVQTLDGMLDIAGRRVALADNALLAHGGYEGVQVELSDSGPKDPKFLDFALLRLAEKVGDESDGDGVRGWFMLPNNVHQFQVLEGLYVLGHPQLHGGQAGPMKLSLGLPSGAGRTLHGIRVRYSLITEAGNSGSPVMDQDFNPVALHHAGTDKQPVWDNANQWRYGFNQGIPLDCIVTALRQQVGNSVLNELGL